MNKEIPMCVSHKAKGPKYKWHGRCEYCKRVNVKFGDILRGAELFILCSSSSCGLPTKVFFDADYPARMEENDG